MYVQERNGGRERDFGVLQEMTQNCGISASTKSATQSEDGYAVDVQMSSGRIPFCILELKLSLHSIKTSN